MAGLIQLDALGANGPYRARARQTVADVAGVPVAELSLVPALFVTRTMSALRKTATLPVEDRVEALSRAATAFEADTINGQSFTSYLDTVCSVSGLGISVVRAAVAMITDSARRAHESVQRGRPVGAVSDWRDPLARGGSAVWTRRGEVFAVHAAGNHPATHAVWLEALALGYRVAVRPSRREPFTPHRLVNALRAAGFGEDRVVLLPTDHDVAGEILCGADLSMVYGGQDVITRYGADPAVLPQGPGRSKILITADVDWRDYLDTIVSSVAGMGGTACTNTTAVLVEGDPAPLARTLADRLAAIPSLPPADGKAVLPVQSADVTRNLEKYLQATPAGTTALLGGDGIVDELPTGGAVLRPAVHLVDRPDARQLRAELPFPCVWVAPWSRQAGITPLRETLVLTAATHDDKLVDALLNEPTIANVYLGKHPTHWMAPGIPHDGYLSEFLMRTKAVIRDRYDSR